MKMKYEHAISYGRPRKFTNNKQKYWITAKWLAEDRRCSHEKKEVIILGNSWHFYYIKITIEKWVIEF